MEKFYIIHSYLHVQDICSILRAYFSSSAGQGKANKKTKGCFPCSLLKFTKTPHENHVSPTGAHLDPGLKYQDENVKVVTLLQESVT